AWMLSPCAPDLPPRAVLAVVMGGDVLSVMSDGTSQTLHRFQPYPPDDGISFGVTVVARDGLVVATATWWGGTGLCERMPGMLICPETDRAVLIAGECRVSWEVERSGRTSSGDMGMSSRIGDQGHVLLANHA